MSFTRTCSHLGTLSLPGLGAPEGGLEQALDLHRGNIQHNGGEQHCGLERDSPQDRDDQPLRPWLPRPQLPGQRASRASCSGGHRGLLEPLSMAITLGPACSGLEHALFLTLRAVGTSPAVTLCCLTFVCPSLSNKIHLLFLSGIVRPGCGGGFSVSFVLPLRAQSHDST